MRINMQKHKQSKEENKGKDKVWKKHFFFSFFFAVQK